MRKWTSTLCALVVMAGLAAADDASLDAELDSYVEGSEPPAANPFEMVASWENRPRFETRDGDFRVEIIGWLMADFDWRSSNAFGPAVNQDRASIRSARFGVQGHIYENALYKLQLEFAGPTAVAMRDVFMGLRDLGPNGMSAIAGHIKEPFGLEFLTPLSAIFFLERSEPTRAFVPDRNMGIMLSSSEAFNLGPRPPGEGWFAERVAWAIGVFRTSDDHGNSITDDPSLTLRVTVLPILEPETNKLLHLGFAYTFRGDDVIQYSAIPGVVDTDLMSVDGSSRFGFELVFLWKGASLSAEWFLTQDRQVGAPNTQFHGGYVSIGTWVTGEDQAFNIDRFVTTAPVRDLSKGPGGVWIGYRYDRLDLNDGAILGGSEQTHTFNVTWNWSWNVRVMLDYVFTDVRNGPQGAGEIHIVRMRFQFNF